MTLEPFRAKIGITALADRFAHGDAFIKGNFTAQMMGPAIDRMYQEFKGTFKQEGIE